MPLMGIGYVRIILKTGALKKTGRRLRKLVLIRLDLFLEHTLRFLYISMTSHQRKEEEAWLLQRGRTLRYAV